MPGKFIKNDISVTIVAKNLDVGQLGEIIDNETYNGMVVTKLFSGDIVALYAPPKCTKYAFETTWINAHATSFHVRVLEPGEQIILSNYKI